MNYRIGLDIGITSVGWSVIENNDDGEPIKIVNLGSRIFEKAENPKTGASLASARREARSSRRRIRRRRHRLERIKYLFETSGLITLEDLENIYNSNRDLESVYKLRYDALNRKLTNEELARVLLHLAKRRGYKANSKAQESSDKETGKLLTAIEENSKLMEFSNYRTIGEMIWKDSRFKTYTGSKFIENDLAPRNKSADYKNTMPRFLLIDEIKYIFKSQRKFGFDFTSSDFEQNYIKIFESQRKFDEGPGGESQYGGSQIEKMIGKDTLFEKEEERAVKATYTFEYFKLLQDINHIRLIKQGNCSRALNKDEREKLIFLAKKSSDLKFNRLRKELDLSYEIKFNHLSYDYKKNGDFELEKNNIDEIEKKAKWSQMQSYHKIRKALNSITNGDITTIPNESLDEIGKILTYYKNDDKRIKEFEKLGLSSEYIGKLLTLNFSKTGNLSIKSMKNIIPYLEQGLTYDKACVEAYGKFKSEFDDVERVNKLSLNKHCEPINNPVVRRAVSQTIKVINAIVRTYGNPQYVSVELARDMGRNFKDRQDIAKLNDENRAANDRAAKQVEEYKRDQATGEDIVKLKLYNEQDGRCLYSGESLDIARLFETGYVDVDHIIPYSKCFNNSYRNKVLVKSSENRQKGNRIPFDYISKSRWNDYKILVESTIRDSKKRDRLLRKEIKEEDVEGFKDRNLNDTRYITKIVRTMIEQHLKFAEIPNGKKHVYAINGSVTSHLRAMWGINKVREDGDLHHAVDAVVIACASDGMIQKITRYYQNQELKYIDDEYLVDINTGEIIENRINYLRMNSYFPEPWPLFRKELMARISNTPKEEIEKLYLTSYNKDEEIKPVFVSRKVNHKVTGAAHEDTIRSSKKKGYTITKTALNELKIKNGEIEGYYNVNSDILLYKALKQRLLEFENNAKEAFKEPFYKPRKDGTNGPEVKKVKITKAQSIGVPINKGITANGTMVRIDLFRIENDGYYFAPIYVNDTVKSVLPNKVVTRNKPYEEWKIVDDSKFICSIYPSDAIKFYSNNYVKLDHVNKNTKDNLVYNTKSELVYFSKASISTASITIKTHDGKYMKASLGIKTLNKIQKYEVDVLGNYKEVKLPEKRIMFK